MSSRELPRPERCADCGTPYGQLNDYFCSKELCPFCHGQLASCGCIHRVLNLTPEETRAVDDYVDDFVEPLKSIVARWKHTVENKGRIPLGEDIRIIFGR